MFWAWMFPKSSRETGCCTGPIQVEHITLCSMIKSPGKLKSFLDYIYLYPVTKGIIFAQTSFAYYRSKENCLPHSEQCSAITHNKQAVTFFSEEVAFIKNSQQGSHAALQFATTEKGTGRDSSGFLDRWLLTLKGQRNCKKTTTIAQSPRKRMAKCVLSSYHMFRDFFSPFFNQAFSFHLRPPVGCSLSHIIIWLHTGSLSFQAPALISNVCMPATVTKAEVCLFICLLDCWARAAEPHCSTCQCNSKNPYSQLPQRVC